MEHAGLGFIDAVNRLAASVGIIRATGAGLATQRATGGARQRQCLLGAWAERRAFYNSRSSARPRRCLPEKTRADRRNRRALCPGRLCAGRLDAAATGDDYLDDNLVGAAWCADDGRHFFDRFRHRIMFPIRSSRGDIIGFGGRVLNQGEPKYLNSPEPLFEKGRELYGLYKAPGHPATGRVLVVEGYMDVVALAQYGVTTPWPRWAPPPRPVCKRLLRQADHVFFCFGLGTPRVSAARVARAESSPGSAGGWQRRCTFVLPSEHDPDSYIHARFGRDAF